MTSMDYKASGVDRAEGDAFVDDISEKLKKHRMRPEVLSGLGDFGGFFEAPKSIKDPVFVAATDGVGTKLLLAEAWSRTESELSFSYRAIGQDVVAMCVNDLLACRAEPLVFLDYLATGKLDRRAMSFLIEGILSACEETGTSLIGGETAEMPGVYPAGRFDIAGFSIGVMERSLRWNRALIQPGDRIFAFKSSGFHSNGYSLIRKILQTQNWSLDRVLEDGSRLGEQLLEPTRLYVRTLLPLLRKSYTKGAAHITGGGLLENAPRMILEDQVRLAFFEEKIPVSPLQKEFAMAAKLSRVEAFSTWNMGVGFVVIVDSKQTEEFLTDLKSLAENEVPFEIGSVEKSEMGVGAATLVSKTASLYFE